MNTKNSEVVIKPGWYCRKSSETEDRQAASIDTQRREVGKMADRDLLVVPKSYQFEEAHSAKTPGMRPLFNKLLKLIEKGEINVLLVMAADRLSRNAIDAAQIIYLMDRKKLLEVRTQGQTFKDTPADKFFLAFQCSSAKMSNDEKTIHVKGGLMTKALAGHYPSFAPIGYMNDPQAERGNKTILVDPDRFPLVRKMWDMLLSGKYTPPQIHKIAETEWRLKTRPRGKSKGYSLSRSNVYHLFDNHFYYGRFEYPGGSGIWHKGAHKPMITQDEFERGQILIHGKRTSPRSKKHTFTYRGFMTCGNCGAAITTDPPKYKKLAGGGVASYIYYHCTHSKDRNCTQGSIEEKELEKQIAAALEELKMPDELVNWALDVLRDMDKHGDDGQRAIITNQRKELDSCLHKIDNLIEMRADQEISAEAFKTKQAQLLKDKERLERDIERASDEGEEDWLNIAQKGLQFAVGASVAFSSTDVKDISGLRREIFSTLGSNHDILNKNLIVKADILLVPIGELAKARTYFLDEFEPNKNGSNKSYLVDDDPKIKSLLLG